MRVLIWHVHGSWMTAFVHGHHTYLVPVNNERDADGRGRAETYEWPESAIELTKAEAQEAEVDVVVCQRPAELDGLAIDWLGGRRPGRDVPAIYVEHTAPQGRIGEMRHPAADRDDVLLVHVTHFNDLFWDAGGTPTRVIEHGIVDPGYRYSGELRRGAAVINEPSRRGRVTGIDLLPRFSRRLPLDLFGIGVGELGGIEDVPQAELHAELARRAVYIHPYRWTSLGLALLEAMHLGMPVVALATTEATEAIPPPAGVVSTRVDELVAGAERLAGDRDHAREVGAEARRAARERYGLERFLGDWDRALEEVGG